MRFCFLDLETTGLSFEKDYITEIAWVVKEAGAKKALSIRTSLIAIPIDVPPEITELTGITKPLLDEAGVRFDCAMFELEADLIDYRVDYIVAHNGENFDKPMLSANIKRQPGTSPWVYGNKVLELPWLDTRADIVYPESWTSRRLNHLAAEMGFLNPFPHMALFDAVTMMKIFEGFPAETAVARAKEPWVTLKACVTYDDREKAKKRRFSWEKCGDKTYPKTWVKRVKEGDVSRETSEADFPIVTLEG